MRSYMKKDIPVQENLIYCYRLLEDKDTIKLVKFTIDKYLYKKRSGYIGEYTFDAKLIGAQSTSYRSFYEDNIDKVVNKQLYTFNLSEVEVVNVFEDHLESEVSKALDKYNKCKRRYELWKDKRLIHELER